MELTDRTLQTLAAVRTGDPQVVSLYLNVDPATGFQTAYAVAFRDRVKALESTLDDPAARATLAHEAERIQRFLDHEYERNGKGLAIFSSEAAGLWEVCQLAVPIETQVHLDGEPYVLPAVRLLDDMERVAVLLLDKEKARLSILQMGRLEEISDISDEVPGKHQQGGWSQAAYQRHHEFHVHEHLKCVLQTLEDYAAAQPFQRLILGGPPESLTEFRGMLSHDLAQRVIGEISVPLFAPAEDVRRAAAQLAGQWEQQDEERQVQSLVTGVAEGGRAVTGWAGTVEALRDAKVYRLLVAEGFSATSFTCGRCGFLSAHDGDRCPSCGDTLARVSDGVNDAVLRTWAQDGRVEVVTGNAAATLGDQGGIGAIVRY